VARKTLNILLKNHSDIEKVQRELKILEADAVEPPAGSIPGRR